MPLHLVRSSRREFLKHTSAAACVLSLGGLARAADKRTDPHLIALLNDTHISVDPDRAPREQNMTQHLAHVVRQLLALPQQPAAVIINGDCALNSGETGDYQQLARLLEPLLDAGMNVHLTMGNHDHRERCFDVLSRLRNRHTPLVSRHITVLETPRANLYLLDSLIETNVVTGELGEEQRAWLAEALDAQPNKPALIVTHHDPQFTANGPDKKFTWSGLRDAGELFKLLAQRRQVKAYFHGHVHHWDLNRHEDIHVVNTPAVGYVFDPTTSTTGYTLIRLAKAGATLTTHTIRPDHAWNNQSHELAWRA